MSNLSVEEQVSANVETPATIETPAVLEEKIYEYQPTDENGRPVGGKQVIKYRTPDELTFKLTEQNTLLIRKLREQTKKARLGQVDTDVIEDSAPRFQNPVEFKPRQLSYEDRVKLSQDLLDPEHFDSAVNTIFEASTGIQSKKLNEVITDLQTDNAQIKAQREVDKFIRRNPGYIVCPENFEAITNWMVRYDLAPVEGNFQKAYDTLKAADVLVTSVEVIPTPTYTFPEPVAALVEATAVEEDHVREEIPAVAPAVTEQPAPVVSRVPSGISRANASDAGTPRPIGDEIVYEFVQRDGKGIQIGEKRVFKGLAAIDAMPSEEYKRRLLHEKGFAQKVEKLEADAAKKRRERG